MDYSKFLPQRKNIAGMGVATEGLDKVEREEAQVNGIIKSMQAIRETAQVVDKAKVKDMSDNSYHSRLDTESREFQSKRGENGGA